MKNILLPAFFTLILTGAFGQPIVTFNPVTLSGGPLFPITDIVSAGNGSGLYIIEKRGVVRVVNTSNNSINAQVFLDIENLAYDSGERGLLGMDFHPEYPDSPYIYVNYVVENTNITRVSRFTVPGPNHNNANEGSLLVLLEVPGIESNHKAGDLVFGPDGYLYVTMGDGGGGGDPQDTGQDFTRMLGKILRIDVNSKTDSTNYVIPADNPYLPYTGEGDTLPEIWMNGVRNPWRISFDRNTGDLWIADVGQQLWEEINMIPEGTGAGLNLGWDCREGKHSYNGCPGNFTEPIFDYPHSCPDPPDPCPNGPYGFGWSVTGGFVYRGTVPSNASLKGYYLFADYGSNKLFLIKQTGSNPLTFTISGQNAAGNNGITTFGESDNGELYAGNVAFPGGLYLISASAAMPVQWENIIATPLPNGNKITWTLHNDLGVEYFQLQRSQDLQFTHHIDVVDIIPVPDQINYTYVDPYRHSNGAFYRVAAYMDDGSIEYSPTARIMPDPVAQPTLTFDFISRMWRINLPAYWQEGELTLYDIQGRVVYNNRLPEEPHFDLASPITPGVYYIKIRGEEGTWSDKIVR